MTPLSAQATAVELAAVNLQGHCDNLARLVKKNARPQAELDVARMSLPALKAAAATLRWLVAHEQPFRDLMAARGKNVSV